MAVSSSSFLSTSSLSNSKSTISFTSSVSPTQIPSLRRVVFRSTIPATSHRRVMTVRSKIREIFMPALSSTMTEGKIVSWIKTEGEKLAKGESVVVVESDKADMEVETFYDGYLAAIVIGEGETAPVGAAIGLLAETEAEIEEAKTKSASKSSPVAEPVVPSPPPATSSPAPAISQPSSPVETVSDGPRKTVVTPYAKKLAKQHKVNIESISGTGPFGRITASDVEAAAGIAPSVASPSPPPAPKATPPVTAKTTNSPPLLPGSSVVPFTPLQSALTNAFIASLSIPAFRVGYSVNTDALDALYKKVKPKGVTMTVLLAKAVGMALAQHPVVNAICKDGKSCTYNSNIDIAVAVAIDGGLMTPVLQGADKLDLYLLAEKWKDLLGRARKLQLQPREYNSGTFILSNLGMYGVDRFDAMLTPGTGAIMAVGASKPTVVADKDGFFSVKNTMQVNVTADHRIIYGADLAAFLQTFAKIVENPDSLTL
ncbi:unnamed protein product [Arabis nemorensis]|uniref:Dihydrolipoamide acetyltransferase component of pyruvate dehydrogenase complex n=1 Tax=Arabis nemorensis TaxID=586526 RepID=A0A565BRS2_9BRAS|nr:unnamed protein product [Arabis nemorensis]